MTQSHSLQSVSPAAVKAMLHDGGELALLDVREQGVFFDAHLLFAVSMPLSQLDLQIRGLVPRLGTRIVLCDGNEGLVERAGEKLLGWGYQDVSRLEGGIEGWKAAGYELFSGINVPSKAFGEFVEHEYGTPSISADELKALLDKKENMIILDSRPMEEYNNMNIPTGVDVPGGELVYRIGDLAKSPETLVVVNCAGRTRSIIGAQSLINAGIPNRVVALRNGTMGWHLAGYDLEHGQDRRVMDISRDAAEVARERARRVAERFKVKETTLEQVRAWQQESGERTLYLLDVRHPEEYEAGHLPGSRNAPGGQLVQSTDWYIATREARVVLIDDTGVRATMTASWLNQMNWQHVYVLRGGLDGELEKGGYTPDIPGQNHHNPEMIGAAELKAAMDAGETVVVDLADSRQYAKSHIEGAWWAIRSRFDLAKKNLPQAKSLTLTSSDGLLARVAAGEIAGLMGIPVRVLEGGTRSWQQAGLPMEQGSTRLADESVDVFKRPYDVFGREHDVEKAMQAYLTWEVGLVEQIERDGDARFHYFEEK